MQRERGAWACLDHPNVVCLYGYTESSEVFGSFGALISPVMRANAFIAPAYCFPVVQEWRCRKVPQQCWRNADDDPEKMSCE
jgi:hypothetical protein